MLTDLSFNGARSLLTIRSNGKLRIVVDALRVEATGGIDVVGWTRRRTGRFGGTSETTAAHQIVDLVTDTLKRLELPLRDDVAVMAISRKSG